MSGTSTAYWVSGKSELKSVLAKLASKQQALIFGHAVPMPVAFQPREYGSAKSYKEFMPGEGGDITEQAEQDIEQIQIAMPRVDVDYDNLETRADQSIIGTITIMGPPDSIEGNEGMVFGCVIGRATQESHSLENLISLSIQKVKPSPRFPRIPPGGPVYVQYEILLPFFIALDISVQKINWYSMSRMTYHFINPSIN